MLGHQKAKHESRSRRHKRTRAKVRGTAKRPRFSVFRSNKHIYAQLIDDEKGRTLVSAKDQELKTKKKFKKVEIALRVGKIIAQKALKKRIKKVVFDKGGYKYHGRVRAVAEGAREGGLGF